jgi:hypothetical protein
VAGRLSIRTFGVRPARLHKVEFNALCSAYVILYLYSRPTKESAVLDLLSVILLIAFFNSLLLPPCLFATVNLY